MARKKPPELNFQQHIADFLVRQHGYAVLQQGDITDTGMFLDKPVVDRNAVQALSPVNNCHEGKKDVVVVDFTNNAKAILKAFAKYREGTPFEQAEPDQELGLRLHAEILRAVVFTQKDATDLVRPPGTVASSPPAAR